MNSYVQAGLSTKIAIPMGGFARSTYYYRATGGKRGKSASTHTGRTDGKKVTNEQIVAEIEGICAEPFIDYGSNRMTLELRNRGYVINPKKVYRLMREHQLLHPKKRKTGVKRQFVRYTSPANTRPFETIEVDIKYVYIQGEKRTAYLLTALDTFSRMAIEWELEYTMKAEQVVKLTSNLIRRIELQYRAEKYIIRTDNGPQFIAHQLSEAIQDMPITHEFIRPGTPEQNGHIESFHYTITRLVFRQYEFRNLIEAKKILTEFYHVYNNKRIMVALLGKSPNQFLELWNAGRIGIRMKGKKSTFFFREKPDQGHGSPPEDFQKLVIQNYIS